MGIIWMPGGGGGADTSVVTATAEDVLAPKVIVGPDGEPIDGTMVNNGAVSHSLPINGTYPIPKGYHDGNGKVSQSIPVQGGSTTTPGTVAKTVVAANRYVNGNIVVAGDSNLIPANIKKNVIIFGVRGIAEGYFPTATDLYLRGNNIIGFINLSGANFDSGQITIDRLEASIRASFNLTGFTKLNFEGMIGGVSNTKTIFLKVGSSTKSSVTFNSSVNTPFVQSIDISKVQQTAEWTITFASIGNVGSGDHGAIYRIWLS